MIVESHSCRQITEAFDVVVGRAGPAGVLSVTSGGVERAGDITDITVNINVFYTNLTAQNISQKRF